MRLPCRSDAARASRQVMRPFPFVSQRRNASAPPAAGIFDDEAGAAFCPPATTIAVDAHCDKIPSRARASRASTVSRYLRLTATTRIANQHLFTRGSHSPASFPLFRCLFTAGADSVRLRRSDVNRRLVPASAAHSPPSCASERRHHVLDIRFAAAGEVPSRVRAVHPLAHTNDDTCLDRL